MFKPETAKEVLFVSSVHISRRSRVAIVFPIKAAFAFLIYPPCYTSRLVILLDYLLLLIFDEQDKTRSPSSFNFFIFLFFPNFVLMTRDVSN